MADADQKDSRARSLALVVVDQASAAQKSALLRWAETMMQIRSSDLSIFEKAKRSIVVTANSETILPLVKFAAAEVKRMGWTDRSFPARLSIGAAVTALTLSGSGAGIAALGTAIGLPLWVVFGAGGAFAGVIIDEARRANSKDKR